MLPAVARAKLSALEIAADDLAALTANALASIKAGEAKLASALHAMETTPTAARAEAFKAEATALGDDIEGLRSIMGERRARRDEAHQLVVRIRTWVERLPPQMTFALVPPAEREPGDESARAAVERYRASIRNLRVEMEAVRKASLPEADIKNAVRAFIDKHAARGRPIIRVEGDKVDVLFENTKALVPGDRLNASASADLFAWLFRDELVVAFNREVEALNVQNALTREERSARLAELRAALLEAERAEEAAITRAGEEGTIIARRTDADPRAVLGIQLVGAASKAA
jgi:hypothetical protein